MARKVPQPHGGSITLREKGDPGGPGRPPKLMTKIVASLKAEGYETVTAGTVKEAIELLIGLPFDKLEAMADDREAPIVQSILANHLLERQDRLALLMELLDRAHGKAKQSVDHTSLGKSLTEVIRPHVPKE